MNECKHPSWDSIGPDKDQCGICGAVGSERRYLKVDAEQEAIAAASKPTLEELKSDMLAKIREAEKAAYAYFCECEVGDERTRAHDVYQNILYATRVR